MAAMEPTAGQRVRIAGSPTQIGVLTGRARDRGRIRIVQVEFPSGTQWVPRDQLEDVTGQREHPVDLLAAGKLGTAADLRRTLTHRRLTGRLADVIYSMEATNTDFYAYQFKPALKLLAAPTNGMLIADEVGLGKTIEAGLIWTELKIRYDLRRLLIVCPAALREKWRYELRSKFGIDARLEDAGGLLRVLREEAEHRRGFAVVASIQGLRPPKGAEEEGGDDRSPRSLLAAHLRDAVNAEPLVDLLVIDEAHHLRNRDTANHGLGMLLRDVADFKLLLTATPIHLGNDDLFAVLELLDPDTFQRRESLRDVLDANRPLVEIRDALLRGRATGADVRAALGDALAHRLLHGNRQLTNLLESLPSDEELRDAATRSQLAYRLEYVNLLAHTITRTRKRDVVEFRVVREPEAQRVGMTPYERRFYDEVTHLVREYARQHGVVEGFLLATPQRQLSSCMAAALAHWIERRDALDDDTEVDSELDDEARKGIGPLTRWLAEEAPRLADPARLAADDSKFAHLHRHLAEYLKKNRHGKVVIFTSFRATQAYLARRLDAVGISSILLSGDLGTRKDAPTKDEVVEQFRSKGGPSVLISTEVGSEGIDLQFSRFLINYDLPWNPMRVEQRIGRLDRIGQTAKSIAIWNLFHADTIDERIYDCLYDRLDLCRHSLGDFEPILGERVRELTRRLLHDELTPEQERERIDQAASALENLRREHETLEDQARHLVAYGDLILDRVKAAHELNRWIDGEDVKTYVTEFFRRRFKGCEFLRRTPDSEVFDVRLTVDAKRALAEFIEDSRLPQTRLADSGPNPAAVRFAHRVAGVQERGVELVSQTHPITRFVSREIQEREEQLTPAVAVRMPSGVDGVADGTYVALVADWSLRGLVTWQKLAYGAVRLGPGEPMRLAAEAAERLVVSATKHSNDWISARSAVSVEAAAKQAEGIMAELSDAFEAERRAQEAQNQDRADIQRRGLERHQAQQDAKLSELRARHAARGREALVRATEGRRAALRAKIETKLAAIESRRAVIPQNDEVLVALVLVGDKEG
jgi:superfamily II DNA or RNA helicase